MLLHKVEVKMLRWDDRGSVVQWSDEPRPKWCNPKGVTQKEGYQGDRKWLIGIAIAGGKEFLFQPSKTEANEDQICLHK